ncbi:MAG: hypothetical protein EBQ94_09335 [Flavobacteriales bacterium]|jgi:hypothetical protein|nr:hypothetical protein [Crocinitomicaceae bacterium]NBX80562.1 hypothetical protein [Flavobacteriales bacterium]NCA19836.1 hypothetical protein [Crocinitomicaceae bacterium]
MKNIFILLVACTIVLSMGSCRKKGDTIANIYVRDEGSTAVENATVVLFGTSTGSPVGTPPGTVGLVNLRDTLYTNSSGLASFNLNDVYQLGQAGVAILNVTAKKANKIGQGIIKIEPETVNEETVFIQP